MDWYWWLLIGYGTLCFCDLLIGNRVFPSKVSVIEYGNYYVVSKIHRFFIFWRVEVYLNSVERNIFSFGTWNNAERYREDTAYYQAKKFSNKNLIAESGKIVWTSDGYAVEQV